MKQVFEITWLTGLVTPELLTSLLQRYARELYYPAGYPVVKEVLQPGDNTEERPVLPISDRYRVVMTPCDPMETKRLNEVAAEGWRLKCVVRRRDPSVEHYRELFYHYFERDA